MITVCDDLLDAQACVDWTVEQFPALEDRINGWLRLNVVVEVEDAGPSDVLVAVQREELARSFNVEIGAYLNTLRSSLDILASALALRHDICAPEDAYFPIARSESALGAPGSGPRSSSPDYRPPNGRVSKRSSLTWEATMTYGPSINSTSCASIGAY
jgi:hypothetical protein